VILKNREKNSMVQEKASLHTLRLGGSSESSYKQWFTKILIFKLSFFYVYRLILMGSY
jgi:hypothetical protein